MTAKDVSRNVLGLGSTLEVAMRRMDEGIGGVIICVDGSGVMRGMLTDGDIRRALLGGAAMSDPVEKHMNRNFTSGSAHAPREDNIKLLGPAIRHVPLLDECGRPVEVLSWAEMWRLPVAEPSLGGNEMKYVIDCIESLWISSQGSYIDRFQQAFATYLGCDGVLCTSSGTTALHLALVAVGVGPGDEVVVPDITFGASANAVIAAGAKPVFVDIDSETRTMDPASFELAVSEKTRAVMPVHLYGHPCDMDPIMEIAAARNIRVVEDCAEALGAEYRGRKVGTIGDVGCFSFFANKVITTGEGGMVVSANEELNAKMALLRDHGMSKERRYWHVLPGFNYRMTNLQAAVGVAQMERIERFLQQRRDVVERYDTRLERIPGIRIPTTAEWARNIHWLYSIEVDADVLGIGRDELARRLMSEGFDSRPVFLPLHLQPAYGGGSLGAFPNSERFAERGLSLPTSNGLTVDEVTRVCSAIENIVTHERMRRRHNVA